MIDLSTHSKIKRKRSRGANLALLCATGLLIVGFLGVAIYTSLQSYLSSELQKATNTAAQVGASAYYSGTGPFGKPNANGGNATAVARNTFNTVIANSTGALSGYGLTVTGVTNNDSNDSVTINTKGTVPTTFLSPFGIKNIELNATATARALRYEPTRFTGPIFILPQAGSLASYSRVITLSFPVADIPGSEIYVEQVSTNQQGYVIEACNDTECYDLTPGATPVGSSKIMVQNGMNVMVGTAMFDLARAGVRKASKIRITHGNVYNLYDTGVDMGPLTFAVPVVINRIMLFGYSGNCVNATQCQVPYGFAPVE